MPGEYNFELDDLDAQPIDIQPNGADERVMQYIYDCARHMGMDARDLHRQILKEWCYSRSFSKEVS